LPSMVRESHGFRISIYSPNDHFAVITAPGSNAVIDLKQNQPQSTVVEGAYVCLDRAEKLIVTFPNLSVERNEEVPKDLAATQHLGTTASV